MPNNSFSSIELNQILNTSDLFMVTEGSEDHLCSTFAKQSQLILYATIANNPNTNAVNINLIIFKAICMQVKHIDKYILFKYGVI
jgi:hypothetical protein